jgi:hypothetical protein
MNPTLGMITATQQTDLTIPLHLAILMGTLVIAVAQILLPIYTAVKPVTPIPMFG